MRLLGVQCESIKNLVQDYLNLFIRRLFYDACLEFEEEAPIDVIYNGNNLGIGFRIDILVENTVILELKSVSQLEKVHYKQLQTYLTLANKPFGYLINFNSDDFSIGKGIHKITNLKYSSDSSFSSV